MKDYKRILQGVVNIINTTKKSDIGFANICTYIGENCPELKESEDERIREALIRFHKSTIDIDGIKGEDIIAWLEAQGKHANFRNAIQVGDKVTRNRDGVLVNLSQLNRVTKKQGEHDMGISETTKQKLEDNLHKALEKETPESWNKFLEEQGEQKSEMIFLKFRIGDKVTNGEDTYTIESIDKDCYWVKEHDCIAIPFEYQYQWELVEQKSTDKVEPKFKVGDWIINPQGTIRHIINVDEGGYQTNEGWLSRDMYEKTFHLWTIQDTKDGDVLYCESSGIEYIVMSKGINKYGHIDSYFRYNSLNGFGVDIPSVFSTEQDNITPATKEQRDLLFQKMKEAGYEWNAKKKELKKIEQKPAWNEEDEAKLKSILFHIEDVENKDVINWFKSLKDRCAWKPSDEHYELEEFAKIVRCNLTGISKTVQELFEAKYLQLTGNKMYGGYKD